MYIKSLLDSIFYFFNTKIGFKLWTLLRFIDAVSNKVNDSKTCENGICVKRYPFLNRKTSRVLWNEYNCSCPIENLAQWNRSDSVFKGFSVIYF